jgi:nitroreductase
MTAQKETLLNALNWRYAVKKFDANKKIDQETWQALEESLILTPSSYGLQPWRFLIVTNLELRRKLTAVSWNQKQVEDCSHLVVFTVKEKVDEAHVQSFVNQMGKVRGVDPATFAGYQKMMVGDVVTGLRSKVAFEWAARQAYIALGNFMTACALVDVDTCPMEGIDPAKYDEILGLAGSGWKTVVACPAGYRASDDKYASEKKVRFDHSVVIEHRD